MATQEKTYAASARNTNQTLLATFYDNGSPSNADIIAALKAVCALLLLQNP